MPSHLLTKKTAGELESLLSEIERTLDTNLYFAAVIMSVAVPDICGALTAGDGVAKPRLFKRWFSENLASLYKFMTGDDCYRLRCGILHQGRCGHPDMQYAKILFTVPQENGNVFHNNIINDALNLDAGQFCRDVIEAARSWYGLMHNDQVVKSNLTRLMRTYPNGLPPYMVGVALIS